MKRSIITALVAALFSTTAFADSQPRLPQVSLFVGKNWGAYYHPKNGVGAQMCQMATRWPDGRVMSVKYTLSGAMFIHFVKPGWKFANGGKVEYVVNFEHDEAYDDIGPWGGHAVTSSQYPDTLEINGMDYDQSMRFLNEFGASERVSVTFPRGNEPIWRTPMVDSRKAVKAFMGCVDMVISANPTTQPAPTQPEPDAYPTKPTVNPNYRGA